MENFYLISNVDFTRLEVNKGKLMGASEIVEMFVLRDNVECIYLPVSTNAINLFNIWLNNKEDNQIGELIYNYFRDFFERPHKIPDINKLELYFELAHIYHYFGINLYYSMVKDVPRKFVKNLHSFKKIFDKKNARKIMEVIFLILSWADLYFDDITREILPRRSLGGDELSELEYKLVKELINLLSVNKGLTLKDMEQANIILGSKIFCVNRLDVLYDQSCNCHYVDHDLEDYLASFPVRYVRIIDKIFRDAAKKTAKK